MEKTLRSLHEIISGNVSFQQYTRILKNDANYDEDEKRQIRMLVNQVINFYFRYENIVNYGEEEPFSLRSIILLALYSTNIRRGFVAFSYEEMLKMAGEDEARISAKYSSEDFPLRIPETLSKENFELSLATRFSVPLFLIEKLRDDIGRRNIVRFFTKRYEERYGIVNEKIKDVEKFYEKYPEFTYDAINETFIYSARGYLKDTAAYKNGEVIVSSYSVLDMYDRIIALNPKTVLFNLYDNSNLLLLFAFLNPDINVVANIPSLKARRILEHLTKKFELTNIRVRQAHEEQFDLVVVCLTNSNINGNVRHRDLYLKLQDDFAKSVDKANKELALSASNVNVNGHLLMMTNTVIRDETHYQALNFLKAHEDFNLLREKQHFHFNDGHESLYYALFTKVESIEPSSEQPL